MADDDLGAQDDGDRVDRRDSGQHECEQREVEARAADCRDRGFSSVWACKF